MSSGLQPPHSSRRRDQLLEQLIVALTAREKAPLKLRSRVHDEPTVALLDAWATVGDVLGFYLDRIADEGYISTAVEPGSLLALAGMVGHRPALGVAAQVHLAYTMNADPENRAVRLPPGLLAQSVPAAGERPQTFETTDELTARPSWSVLSPKQTEPLKLGSPEDAANLAGLVVHGATANLAPNDTILLELADAPAPALLRVAGATVDAAANVTRVALHTPSPRDEPPATPPADVTTALDGLLHDLSRQPAPIPQSVNDLPRTVKSVFSSDSDAVPHLLSTLRPQVGGRLYQGLDQTPLGSAPVSGASVLRVKAAPFGAQAPPKQLFDERGQPVGTEDWPIGDALRLTLNMTDRHFGTVLDRTLSTLRGQDLPIGSRLKDIAARLVKGGEQESGGNPLLELGVELAELSDKAMIELGSSTPPDVPLANLGTARFGTEGTALTLSYEGRDSRVKPLKVNATIDPKSEAIALQLDSGEDTYLWDPNVRTPIRAHLGTKRLSIVWSMTPPGDEVLSLSLESPLPLTEDEQKVLRLDSVYGGILPGDSIVIDRVASEGATGDSDITYPVLTKVRSSDNLAASGYGLAAHVTRVTLEHPWVGDADVLQASLREITIRAQPSPLDLAPVPLSDDVGGDAQIELDQLVAGMEPGRLIIVRGSRTDLPGGATVKSGEMAMVQQIISSAQPGEKTHSTLQLATPLAYKYKRESVEIFANVVPARQGATITEILGSGQPTQPHQGFTLSSAPLLADPALGPGGARSTLTVQVDGVGYREVERFAPDTDPRSFLTGTDPRGHTTIVFAAPLPAGSENVKAAYRAGDGAAGNVRPDQISQLLSRPAGVAGVTNPLPGSGGLAGDGPEAVRAATPLGLGGLGRVVTPSDYAEFARGWNAVGKAAAQAVSDGKQEAVLVTIAARDPVPLDRSGGLCTGIAAALADAADPGMPVLVAPADLWVIVLEARVTRDPLIGWDDTVADVTAALLATFAYQERELGADVVVGDLIAAAHRASSVRSFRVTSLALVPATANAFDLATTLPEMLASPVPDVVRMSAAATRWTIPRQPGGGVPAAVSYLANAVSDSLILIESPA